MGEWLDLNGEASYGTRPWEQYQEKLDKASGTNNPSGKHAIDANSIRFTRSADSSQVYCILLFWPEEPVKINSLAGHRVSKVRLLGSRVGMAWHTEKDGLVVTLPKDKPCKYANVLVVSSSDS